MSNRADYLFELGCEELPPKSLSQLGISFSAHITEQLNTLKLEHESIDWFATPRRLTISINSIITEQPNSTMERRGPAVKAAYDAEGNPTKAALGFAASCGTTVDQLKTITTKKGSWIGFDIEEKGKTVPALLPEIIEKALNALPIAKRIRWGKSSATFVRPVHWITSLWNNEHLPIQLFGVESGCQSYGHRIHTTGPIEINSISGYAEILESKGKVVASFEKRKGIILDQVKALADSIQATAVIDNDLLEEVTALVEWPVALMGNFDEEFLEVPQEALISSMQEHQKYFPLVNADKKLLPHFITISNLESKDQAAVVSGNEKVIRPRLADAQFFYNQDQKKPLTEFANQLKSVTFQHKLGSVFEKTERIAELARWIAEQIGGNGDSAFQAGQLCKADLASNMVGEFPELQGIMGMYYFQIEHANSSSDDENASADPDIAFALKEQYLPKFSGDELPQSTVGTALSIADKIDTLVGIFGINQPPSGVKDPFGLRRASLGIIRICIEKKLELDLKQLIKKSLELYSGKHLENEKTAEDLFKFIFSRYRTFFQSQGIETDVIQSVEQREPTIPYDFDARIKAVDQFRKQPEASSLAEANKRVHNILKKSESDISQNIDESLLQADEERALFEVIASSEATIQPMLHSHRYSEALIHLANLKQPVDLFFDNVMVNVEDIKIRDNRLALLNKLRELFLPIADISYLK